jgi:hypothetical protein
MPLYRIVHESQVHEFSSMEAAQQFLDNLPSRVGVEIVEAPLLFQYLNAPGAPLVNWREINAEICEEFGRAKTEDYRVSLLAGFKATMDIAETTVAPESLKTFQEARSKQYKTFIVEEALVGENVCVETLDLVTKREIAAGRMAPDHTLRKLAEESMAAPHLSRAELLAQAGAQAQHAAPTSLWQRLSAWLKKG